MPSRRPMTVPSPVAAREHPLHALQVAQRHLARRDARLARVIRQHGPCGLRPRRHYFRLLVSSIVGQQLSGKAADTIFGRLAALSPGQQFPRPEQLLVTPDDVLRAVGLSGAKTRAVKDLCAHVLDGRLDLRHLSRQSDAHIVEALVAVRGIGEWTAHMFLMFSLFRLDVLPTGDLGIRKGFQRLYGLPAMPAPPEMHALAEANGWAPYRSVACWYLWRLLD